MGRESKAKSSCGQGQEDSGVCVCPGVDRHPSQSLWPRDSSAWPGKELSLA